MKCKIKRLFTLSLAVCMAASLAACGEKPPAPVSSTPASSTDISSQASAAPSADVDDGSEHFEYVWIGKAYTPVTKTGEEAKFQKILEDKFNVTLKPLYLERSNFDELINLKFASNEIPDVFTCANSAQLNQWVNQGLVGEIKQSDIREYAPSIAKDIDSFLPMDPFMWKYTIINGKNYALQETNADVVFRQPVVWRTDWLKNVGIDKIPETIEEYETALYKFAKEDPDGNGKNDTYGMSNTGMEVVYGISGYLPYNWTLRDGNPVWGAVQPEMKEALAYLQKWYKDGVIDPEFVTTENQGGYWARSHAFINGRIGMSAHGSYYHWNPPYFEGQEWASTNGKDFQELQKGGAYDFGKPASKDGKGGAAAYSPASNMAVIGVQMEKEPKKIQRFLKIQDALASDYDLFLNIRYGDEGVHYEWDQYHLMKGIELPEGEQTPNLGGGQSFFNYTSAAFLKKLNPAQYEFGEKVCGDMLMFSAVNGALPSQPQYKAELDKLQQTTFTRIITGDLPIDHFDKFVEEWMNIGGAQLTKEAAEWYQNVNSYTCE